MNILGYVGLMLLVLILGLALANEHIECKNKFQEFVLLLIVCGTILMELAIFVHVLVGTL